jgi:hypothetical protein
MSERAGDLVHGAIRLESDQVPEVSVVWFRELFHEAWDLVPGEYQMQLEAYWRGRIAPPNCYKSPLFKDSYDPRIILLRHDGLPGVNHGGHLVFMPLGRLMVMPRKVAVLAVTHELVHISFHAEGEPQHWRLNGAGPTNYNASERLVDERLLDWGFSKAELDAADRWLADHGLQRFENLA